MTDGSQVAEMDYDGLGRRICKDVDNTDRYDYEYHFYYSGSRIVEERNGLADVIKQYVWGTQYV